MPLLVPAVTELLWSNVPLVTLRPVPGWIAPFADAVASGRSAATSARKVGAASAPEAGPINTVLAPCVSKDRVMFAVKSSGLLTTTESGVESVTVTSWIPAS